MPILAGGRTARDPAALAADLAARFERAPTWLGYRYQQLAILGWTSICWLHTLRAPTLVLHGDDDPIVPVLNARLLASRLRDVRLEIVRGAGHLLLFDEPSRTAPILSRFLDQED